MTRQLLSTSLLATTSIALGVTACAPDVSKQYHDDLATNARPTLIDAARPTAPVSLTITPRALYLQSREPFSAKIKDALEGVAATHDTHLIALGEDTSLGVGASSSADAAQIIDAVFALEAMGHPVTEFIGGAADAPSAVAFTTRHCKGSTRATTARIEERCDVCAKISGRDALEARTCTPLVVLSSARHVDLVLAEARLRAECAQPLLTSRELEDAAGVSRVCADHASFTSRYKHVMRKNELCPEVSFGAREAASYGALVEHMMSAHREDATRELVLLDDAPATLAACDE